MSILDTAKDIVRISSAAGLGKDVIDLLEKKSALLKEQVLVLEQANSQLKVENAQLRQQLQLNSGPKQSLSSEDRKILEFLDTDITDSYINVQIIADRVGIDVRKAKFLLEQLEIVGYVVGTAYSPPGYHLTLDGREVIYRT